MTLFSSIWSPIRINNQGMTPGSQNPKVVGTLVIVFLAGASAGALTMRLGLHERLHRGPLVATAAATTSNPAVPRMAPSQDAVLQRFKTDLNLTGDQADKIAMVLEDYRHYYHNLQDQLDDVRSTGKQRIMQILDSGQRAKFDKIMGELQPQIEKK
jgi:hypothetical protein